MQLKGKKICILSTIIVYCVSFLIQSNFSLLQTLAQESNIPRVNIVAVLVDDQIYNSISSGLSRYTTNYVQQQLSDTKALVMPLNLNNISAYDIYRMMENVYFDGLENTNSSLIGLIMVGEIPLPVVNQNGYIFPTVYPYVDFENQKYVWDEDSNYFVPNGNPNGQAEIWHGLIDYGDDTQAYLDFFNKVKSYSQNPDGFIGDSMWYEDFIANKEGFINEYFQYYKNKIMFGEDLSYQRYSPLMKKILGNSSIDASLDILSNLQDAAGVEFPGTDDSTVNSLKSQGDGMHTTKIIQQEIQDSYLADYNELFSKIGLSRMRENIFAGGRWIKTYTDSNGQKSQIVDADSSSSMIQLKDTLYLGNDDLKGLIENLNELMEDMVDNKIENEKYSMDIVIPVQLEERTGKRVWGSCYTFVDRYENYYFGRDARYIDDPRDLSIYRGTYRNLNSLNGVTYTSLANGYNPPKSQYDSTNLKLKSIGASYDIFSTQVEGNRGYNNFLVSDDLDTYDANKARAQEEEQTVCLRFLCRLRKRSWPTNCSDDDGNCEDINEFATRWWGGASAMNLEQSSISNGRYALSGFRATNSWRSIFDVGGFQALLQGNDEGMSGRGWVTGKGTGPQKAATSFKAYIKYSSPTQTEGWTTRGRGKMIYINHMPDQHKDFSKLDYWHLSSDKLSNWVFSRASNSDQMFTVADGGSTKGCGWKRDTYTYRFLSSVIKHNSTTDAEINGMDYYKYSDTGEAGMNNANIVKSYTNVLNSISGAIDSYQAIYDTFSGNKQIMLGWTGVNSSTGVSAALSSMNQIIDSTQSGLSLLYDGLSALSLDEITSVYESIIYSWGGNPGLYTGTNSNNLKKIELLSDRISDINRMSSAINASGLVLKNAYNTSIQSVRSQINIWNSYANSWKDIDGVDEDLIDDVSSRFSNNLFILTAESDPEGTGDNSDNADNNGEAEEEFINLQIASISGWNEFVAGYSTINSIFSNLITADHAGSSIISIANADTYFRAWVNRNNIQLDFNNSAELITTYAQWALKEGAESPRVKTYHDDLQGVVSHEPGMNLLTPDRPIDSPRYVSMQSIAGNEINLIYPDLFKVEVFKKTGQNNSGFDIHVLLPKAQIKENLIKYLSGKVAEFNTILSTEYNNAASNSLYYQKLRPFNLMATPDKASRPYGYFTYDEFVESLGGEGMLDVIVDMLYYQNLTNKKKLSSDNVSKDVDLIKKSFNVNDKREEVLKDYLTEGSEMDKNIALVIPTYEISGYEVAYVNSNGRDYIIPVDSEDNQMVLSISDSSNSDDNGVNTPNGEDDNNDNNRCNIPLNGTLPLFKIGSDGISSPWYQGFECWLDNLEVKVKITFDNAIGTIFTKGLTGFLGETLAEPFTSWRSSSVGESSGGGDLCQNIVEMQMDADDHNREVMNGDDGVSNAFSTFSRNIRINNSNLSLSDSNPVSELKISSTVDVGNINVIFSSIGDGCLKLEDDNLCNGNSVSRTFNPKTDPLTLHVSSADYVAGCLALDVKITLGGQYIWKVYKYTVSPSELESIDVIVDNDKTVAGMLTPIEIVGYDQYNNRVSRGLTNYDFKVSVGEFLKDGVYQTGFTTNDFRYLKLYYHAPVDAANNSEAIIEIVKSDDNTKHLATHTQRIVQASPEISLDGSIALSNNSLRASKSIRLTSDEDIYNDMGKLDVSKLHTIVLNMKDAGGNIVGVNSQISITSQKGLIKLGQVYKNAGGDNAFYETASSYMSGGIATIYYYPTTVAGDDVININIPGLDTRIIDLSVLPSSWANTQIMLEKDVLNLGDTMNVEIFLSDKWGNLVDGSNTVSILYDDEKIELVRTGSTSSVLNLNSNNLILSGATSLSGGLGITKGINGAFNGSIALKGGAKMQVGGIKGELNLSINNGYSKLEAHGVGAGLSYIIGGNSYVEVTVDKHLFPNSGLNIMYLNYFGDDWGNQWGYFSDHNKYIESLMKKSNKIITTTTQLVSEDKIKRIVWKIDPGFKIWNPDNTSTILALKNGKINIKVGGITNMVSNQPSLNWMSVNEDTIESILGNSNTATRNYAFFISNGDNYSVREGILYSGDESIFNILNGDVSLQLTQSSINGDNVWSVINDGVDYGKLIIHYPGFVPNLSSFNLPGSRYSINSTFTNGSTANILSVGIFDTQSSFELNSSYKSIQDSSDTSESIGFQGDFKNITLFAEGEIVGEATRKFGSEFVINLGDPVLSRKSLNENVYGTHYDGGIGQEIYADSENDIVNTHEIDFNNDGLKDLLVVYLDGSLKLAKNYGSTPDFRNMQEIMRIAIPIKEVYVGDVDGNNYDDIIIRTQNNQVRVYLNNHGIFDVDGNVVCLNINVDEGEVSQSPSDLSGLYQIFVEDMDMDNIIDFITYDHKGYIKIFYGGTTNGYSNYLSKQKYACDTGWYNRQISNMQIITALGMGISSDRIYDNSMLRRVGMEKSEVEISENNLSDFGVTINTSSLESKITKKDRNHDMSISAAMDEIMGNFDINKASEQFINNSLKYQEVSLYENELVGGSGNIYTFAPISYLTPDSLEDKAVAWKNYSVKNGGSILSDGDIVTVTVTIQAKQSFVGSFGDIIQGPWKLYFNDKNIFQGIEFVSNQRDAVVKKRDGNFAYLIDNISLNAGETMVFKYDLEFTNLSPRNIDVTYRTLWSDDDLPDIKLQATDGCEKNFDAFVNSGLRVFSKQTIPLQEMIDDIYEDTESRTEDYSDIVAGAGSDVTQLPGMVGDKIQRQSVLGGDVIPVSDDADGWNTVANLFAQGGIDLNIDLSLFGDQTSKIESVIDDITKGMCNGFSFGGSNNCAGLPVPFNQAFLAPGKYHLFGCWDLPLGPLENGIPIFHFPGTITVPAPIPFPWGMKGPGDSFIWVPGGEYPSLIRIYAAPTLTAQLGLAICLGPYSMSLALPSPIGDVAGNCIVFAIKPQCKNDSSNGGSSQDPQNPNETYSPIVEDVRDSGSCTLTQKGPMVTDGGYRSSPFNLYSYNSNTESEHNDAESEYSWFDKGVNFLGHAVIDPLNSGASFSLEDTRNIISWDNVDVNGGTNNGVELSANFLGIVEFENSAFIGMDDDSLSTKNSIMIGNVDILGGDFSVNKILGGLQQGLRKLLIDKWLDPQIRYIANQLTKMHIVVKLPDIHGLVDNEKEAWDNIINNLGDMMGNDVKEAGGSAVDAFKSFKLQSGDNVSKYLGRTSDSLKDFGSSISNPFEALASLMNQSNIFNISVETLTVKVPMIMPEDIASYGIYLQQWLEENKRIIEDWKNAIEAFGLSCSKKETVAEQERCYEDAQKALSSLVEFEQVDWQKMQNQIYTNIQILQEYRNFPFEMYERIHVIDRYMEEIASLVNNTLGYLSYWMVTNEERFVGYVDAIVLIINIIKTYQLIIDFSVEWGKNCGNCANDTYDQYSCKLSLLCDAIELPIIQIPNFKIPNITIDLSNIDLGLDIVLPKFNFQAIKVQLPDLPNLPEPPSVGINIKLFDLPDIPQLPEPPELPELPSFIPQVEIELPVLPPAPEIPRLPNKIETTINLANMIGKIYCIVKGSFGLVGEKSVKAKIEQLTQRTYEVKWIDYIMDFTNWTAAPIKNYGVDYEISTYVDLQFNFSTFYDFMDMVTKQINDLSTSVQDKLQDASDWVQSGGNALQGGMDGFDGDYNFNFDLTYNGETSDDIEYVDYTSAKNRLYEVLAYFKKEAKDTTFVDSLNSSIKKIENQVNTQSKIEANVSGIETVENEILDYLNDKTAEYDQLAELINNDYEGFLAMIDNQNKNEITSGDSEKLLTFNVQLFNLDGSTKETLTNLKNQNPYLDLLDNKKDIVNGYWDAIMSNTADSLGLSQSQYLVLRDNIGNMKKQVATMYSVVRPTQSTSLIAKNSETSVNKTMVVQNGASLGGGTESSLSVDPQSFTNGIYEKLTEGDEAGERLAKVVYSDSFAEEIGKHYYTTSHLQNHDIILRTTKSIYKKCANQVCDNGGNHFNGYYMRRIDTIPYKETWVSFDSNTKLKIADVNSEVKNFKVKGQTYDDLSFSWTLDDVDGYLIKLVERVDYSYEKADYTDNSVRVRYVLALPKGIKEETLYQDNVKLELLKNRVDEIRDIYGGDLVEIVYYDVHKPGSITISNIERKWYYLRIAALGLIGDTYTITSPWSNQIVAGRQIVGDDLSPTGRAELYRPSTSEVVSEGNDLQGYVGTKYKLNIVREDNVALSYINLSKDGIMLDEKYTSKTGDTVSVDIAIHSENSEETYSTVGIDQFGNKTEKNVIITFDIPSISVVDVSKNSDGETASIIAELSQDVDQGNVSFQRRRGDVRKTMKRKNEKYADVKVGPNQTTVVGGPYTVGNDIAMYDKNNEVIALMDPNTAEIKIQSGYQDSVKVKVVVQNSAVLQLYNNKTKSDSLVFSIAIPMEKLVKIEAEGYTIKDLSDNSGMGMFNGGKAVYKDGENILFISPTGHLYSELGLEGTYDYDRELETMVLTVYQLSDLQKKNPIKLRLKVQPFVAK